MHIVICMDYGNAKSICTYYGDAELWKLHCNGVIRIINIFYRRKKMKYICDVCGWEYDEEKGYPEGGIAPGTKWEELPEDFTCPLCSVGKDQFSEA